MWFIQQTLLVNRQIVWIPTQDMTQDGWSNSSMNVYGLIDGWIDE